MDISTLISNLNTHSINRVRNAKNDMCRVLDVREELRKIMHNPRVNYWETAVQFLNTHEFFRDITKEQYIVLSLLYVDIRRNGVQSPIILRKKTDEGIPMERWDLRNGHHRVAISEMLGINDIPIKFDDPKPEN